MVDELNDLMNKVTLDGGTEEDDAVVFDDRNLGHEVNDGDLCLVAKMFMRKPTNKEAMKIFGRIWQQTGNLEVQPIGDKDRSIKFSNMKDKLNVLQRQSWSFNKSLMVFCHFDESIQVKDYDFTYGVFWLQLHNLPTKQVGCLLGPKAGFVEQIEMGNKRIAWGRWLRVRVRVQVAVLMKQGCWLALSSGRKFWIAFHYERGLDFCYFFGCLDHTERDYEKGLQCKEIGLPIENQYGPELRAETYRPSDVEGGVLESDFSGSRLAYGDNCERGCSSAALSTDQR